MIIDALRHKNIEPRLEATMDVAMEPDDMQQYERNETIAQLVRLVKEDSREVFILRAVEGRSLNEVAALTGLEPKTISQRVQRLIAMLHKMMSEELKPREHGTRHTAHGTRHTAHGTRHTQQIQEIKK
jgi:RNA polymerase sigma factor (sigma-70 family)